jgi:hypothetical protein
MAVITKNQEVKFKLNGLLDSEILLCEKRKYLSAGISLLVFFIDSSSFQKGFRLDVTTSMV